MANTANGVAYFQAGGAGYDVGMIASGDESTVAAPSGGGITAESLFSGPRYKASRKTANKSRVTSQVSVREDVATALETAITNGNCFGNLIVARGCVAGSKSVFDRMHILVDAAVTSPGYSGNILDGTSGDNPDLMRQVTFDAGAQIIYRPVAHSSITGTVFANAFNHIIPVNLAGNCAGACGATNDGSTEFIMVSDGLSPATVPYIFYTANSGNTWVQQTIAVVTNGTAESVAICGDRVIVACSGTTAGIYIAPLADVKLGTAVFALASGITNTWVINSVVALDSSTALACGASGRLLYSTDAGYSWTALTSGVATALNAVACGSDKSIAWAVGASGVVLRIRNLRTVQAVTGAAVGTDSLTTVAVPWDRPNEMYLGSATGEIHRVQNAYASQPTWEELTFDKPSGGGIIEYIAFADARGTLFSVVQSNASTQSRVLWDVSGGNMADWAISVGTFTSPGNSIINAIAPISVNFALTCGEPVSSQGFIGSIGN